MEIIDQCKDLLQLYYAEDEKEKDEEKDEIDEIEEALKGEAPKSFQNIIDTIHERIEDYYINDGGDTNASFSEKTGCYFECAELIGKTIIHEIKLLAREGTYFNFNKEDIASLTSTLAYLRKQFGVDKNSMDDYSKKKRAECDAIVDTLKNTVPIHWTYDPVI